MLHVIHPKQEKEISLIDKGWKLQKGIHHGTGEYYYSAHIIKPFRMHIYYSTLSPKDALDKLYNEITG